MLPFKKRARSSTNSDTNTNNAVDLSSSSSQYTQNPYSSFSSDSMSTVSSHPTTFMVNTYVSSQVSPSADSTVGTVPLDNNNNNILHSERLTSVRKVVANIPERKSSELIPIAAVSTFSCDITCHHHISYQLLQNASVQQIRKIRQSELDKLDIVLNSSSTLNISCSFLINGLDNILEYPNWMNDNLVKMMKNCGFSHIEDDLAADQEHLQQSLLFKVSKAFVTTPLSYIMDKQTPHAILNKLDIVFDFSINGPSNEFVTNWKRKFNMNTISDYAEHALAQILLRKTFYLYPLIFSTHYAKKLSQTSAYLPHIAQSLQKIYMTSKSTMSVSNHEFSESMLKKVRVIKKNVEIMCPLQNSTVASLNDANASDGEGDQGGNDSIENENEDSSLNAKMISFYLTLGMYQSIKRDNKPKSSPTKATLYDPPNALCTIAQLWSVTCSATSSN